MNGSQRGKLVIVGAGGFAREVVDVVKSTNRFELLGLVADGHTDAAKISARGLRVLGPVSALAGMPDDVEYVIAIGDGGARSRITAELGDRRAATLVHSSAVIGWNVELAPGAVVCAGALVTADIRIGKHTHINLGVTVGHDCVIGDYVTISPGSSLSGNVVLEDQVTVGTRAALIPGVRVGAGAVLGAGAVVTKDIPPGVTAVGMPARPL